jgi:lipopolysaccharide export system permease protein
MFFNLEIFLDVVVRNIVGWRLKSLLTVIDKLIITDLVKTLFSVWTVIVVILVSRKFVSILDKAVNGQVANDTLLSILGLKTVIASIAFLPPALFMTILMVLGRMYRDQEMSAIASAGGGARLLYRAVFLFVFPLSILTIGLSLNVAPWAEAEMDRLIHNDEKSADIRGIAAGKFSEYSHGDLVFYVEKITDDKKMHGVFVQKRDAGKLSVINSESARMQDLEDGRYIVFENGERVQGTPGALDFIIEHFGEYAVRLEEKDMVFNAPPAAIPTVYLLLSTNPKDVAELQKRIALPLGMMLLSFLAIPLAQISPRGGVYGNMLVGFLIYFTYANFTRVSQAWVMNEKIPAWFGIFGINSFLLLTGIVLLIRWYGFKWFLMEIRKKTSL